MSTHSAEPSPTPEVPTSASATILFDALHQSHDENGRQAFLLSNDTPERDCIADYLSCLPADERREMARLLAQIIGSNNSEYAHTGKAWQQIKLLLAPTRLTLTRLVAETRPHVKVLAAVRKGKLVDARHFTRANHAVRDIVSRYPEHIMRSKTVEHELGGRQHAELLAFLEEQS